MGAGELWKQRPVSNHLTVTGFPSNDAVMEMSFLNECQKDMDHVTLLFHGQWHWAELRAQAHSLLWAGLCLVLSLYSVLTLNGGMFLFHKIDKMLDLSKWHFTGEQTRLPAHHLCMRRARPTTCALSSWETKAFTYTKKWFPRMELNVLCCP